jgi:peptide chain release factor subunit 1
LLADDNKFGFIVMDGNGALFGTLQGNTREVLHKFTVDLPKKHGTILTLLYLSALIIGLWH